MKTTWPHHRQSLKLKLTGNPPDQGKALELHVLLSWPLHNSAFRRCCWWRVFLLWECSRQGSPHPLPCRAGSELRTHHLQQEIGEHNKNPSGQTHLAWFAHADSTVYHPQVKQTTIPSGKHRKLIRFWLACADIEVNAGQFVALRDKKARFKRVCP